MPTTLRRQKNRPTTSDTKPKTGPLSQSSSTLTVLYIDCIDLHIDLCCQKLSIFSLCTVQGTRIYSTLVIFSVPLDFCTVHGARCFIHPCLTAPAGLVPGGIFTHRVGPRWDFHPPGAPQWKLIHTRCPVNFEHLSGLNPVEMCRLPVPGQILDSHWVDPGARSIFELPAGWLPRCLVKFWIATGLIPVPGQFLSCQRVDSRCPVKFWIATGLTPVPGQFLSCHRVHPGENLENLEKMWKIWKNCEKSWKIVDNRENLKNWAKIREKCEKSGKFWKIWRKTGNFWKIDRNQVNFEKSWKIEKNWEELWKIGKIWEKSMKIGKFFEKIVKIWKICEKSWKIVDNREKSWKFVKHRRILGKIGKFGRKLEKTRDILEKLIEIR